MQGDISPIGVLESFGCGLKFFHSVPALRRPGIPHRSGKVAAIVPHRPFPTRRGHIPVVPIVTRLLQAELLRWVVRAIRHRHHHKMAGKARAQPAGNRHSACTPIVADQRRLLQAQRIDKFQQIALQRSKLACAWRVVSQALRWPETLLGRHQYLPPRQSQA